MAKAGKGANVKAYGSEIVFTNEVTTSALGDKVYQITNVIKRIFSRTTLIVVKDGGVPTIEAYVLDRLTGRVTFSTAVVRVITITGAYLPVVTVLGAHEYNYELSADNLDSTAFTEEFISRQQGLKDISGSISKFFDISKYFWEKILTNQDFILEFYSDYASGVPDCRAWAKLSKDDITAAVDGLIDESIDFDGNDDQEDHCVSFGPF